VIDAATQRYLSETLTLANTLGALVFPYKGEDIVETILHFAKEYRVGHIVIGRPGPLPLWKRLIGRKSLVERLILKARGLTVVVVDPTTESPGMRSNDG
jgi:two-component system, OmpR family, sensor histidine kinase KdpD